MKRPTLIIVSILLLVIFIATASYIYYSYKKRLYHPEVIEAEIYEDVTYDTDLLIGRWQSGTLYYWFNEDGTALTWDTADDVTEEEASSLTWTLERSRFTHIHHMGISKAVVPKHYRITQLDLLSLIFEDEFGTVYTFTKAD